MKYNTCMEFDLQDYHFLKSTTDSIKKDLDKVEDEITSMLPEKSTGNSIVLKKNETLTIDIIATEFIDGAHEAPVFTASTGMTVIKKTTSQPQFISEVSEMRICWTTYSDDFGGTYSKGIINWNNCIYTINTPGSTQGQTQWTLTLPEGFNYKITKNYF